MTNIAMEIHHAIDGKTHSKSMAMFNSYVKLPKGRMVIPAPISTTNMLGNDTLDTRIYMRYVKMIHLIESLISWNISKSIVIMIQ